MLNTYRRIWGKKGGKTVCHYMHNKDLDTETIQAGKDKSLKNKYGTQEARILQNSNTIMAFMSINPDINQGYVGNFGSPLGMRYTVLVQDHLSSLWCSSRFFSYNSSALSASIQYSTLQNHSSEKHNMTDSAQFFPSLSEQINTAVIWCLSAHQSATENRIRNVQKKNADEMKVTYRTILLCCISLRSEISRMAVLGTPSSSCSNLIFFSATVSFVTRSRAR